MKKEILLLTTNAQRIAPESARIVDYSESRVEAGECLLKLGDYKMLWLEAASEFCYFEGKHLTAIESFVKKGGGLLVTGGLGSGYLFRTIIEEMLPVNSMFEDDRRPAMSVRDARYFPDSFWYGSGRVKIEKADHPVIQGTGINDNTIMRGNYVSFPKPGANIITRFDCHEMIQTRRDLEPRILPLITTWTWYGGRTVYIGADPGMFPDHTDIQRLITNILEFIKMKPEINEIIEDRKAFLHATLTDYLRRMALLDKMEIGSHFMELFSLAKKFDQLILSAAKPKKNYIKKFEEIDSIIRHYGHLIESAESSIFRRAFNSYMRFYYNFALAEVTNSMDDVMLESIRYQGEMAKLDFNTGACFEASLKYDALCFMLTVTDERPS